MGNYFWGSGGPKNGVFRNFSRLWWFAVRFTVKSTILTLFLLRFLVIFKNLLLLAQFMKSAQTLQVMLPQPWKLNAGCAPQKILLTKKLTNFDFKITLSNRPVQKMKKFWLLVLLQNLTFIWKKKSPFLHFGISGSAKSSKFNPKKNLGRVYGNHLVFESF